ncbi:MAG: penicillin-binding protein 2, partial [Patescibacteria group bacterium]
MADKPWTAENFVHSFLRRGLSDRWKRFRRSFSTEDPFSWQDGLVPMETGNNGYSLPGWSAWRGLGFLFLAVVLFLLIWGRLFFLQVVEGAKNRALSEQNRLRIQVVRPPRGIIYDRYGTTLASNEPGFRVVWKSEGPVPDWEKVSEVLGLPQDSIIARAKKAEEEDLSTVVLKSPATRDEALHIETKFVDFPGLVTEVSPLRSYPYGHLFSHVLGYTGEAAKEDLDNNVSAGERIGKTGLEKEFDFLLRGKEGKRLVEADVWGEDLREVARENAVQGRELRTSLDFGLQEVGYSALQEGLEKSGATGGSFIAQDPQTGEVLSFVSLPDFEPQDFVQGLSTQRYKQLITDPGTPLLNRAIQSVYPPGSIFKIVTATAALEQNSVSVNDYVDCKGAISVGSFVYRDWKIDGHGRVNLLTAIAQSCDIYFYIVGGGYQGRRGVGADTIARYARLYGLGATTGVELPDEAEGLVPDPEWKEKVKEERWYVGNTYHFSIGQGDLAVTPLQLNNMVSAAANGGKVMKPTLLLGDGGKIVRGDFISENNLDLIREGLRRVMRPGGTGYPFFDSSYDAGGKTGTAETGGEEDTHAWFVAFAPFEDPQIALTVFLENGGGGSSSAAPVAKKVMDWYFENRVSNQ